MNFRRKKGYEILKIIKAIVTDKKDKAMGRSKISVISPLNIIKVCRMLFSVIGPNTTPIIKGATGKFHFRNKYPITPAMIMTQTSKMEFLTL